MSVAKVESQPAVRQQPHPIKLSCVNRSEVSRAGIGWQSSKVCHVGLIHGNNSYKRI